MKQLLNLFIIGLSLQAFAQSKATPNSNSGEKEVNNMKTNVISNAGKAKTPNGKIKFTMDGKVVETPQNQNQCMIVGMGNEYGQLLVSCGNKLTITYIGKQKLGLVEIRKTAGMPNVGLQILDNGIQYTNMKNGDVSLEITKMTPDGKNIYIAGKFSGTLKSPDGQKTIVITNGTFESGYVQ